MDGTLRALADPTRRAILWLVRDGEVAAGEIAHHFPGMSRPAVSQHLRVLADAGLIRGKPIKQWIFYKREEAAIAEIKKLIQAKI